MPPVEEAREAHQRGADLTGVNTRPRTAAYGRSMAATPRRSERSYSIREEVANGATHGLGAALSIAGLAVLLVLAARTDAWRVVSVAVFGTSLVGLYCASTLYHLAVSPRAKHVLKVLDHVCIYVLIAGTYTPFLLVTLRGSVGWWMFILVWSLAITGALVELLWVYRPKWLSVLVYLAMGWMVVIATAPLRHHLAGPGLVLLFAGGAAYTLGTIFYVLDRPYMHSVWHVFVLAGSACHFVTVAAYVVPTA
jgi:hemolysin III